MTPTNTDSNQETALHPHLGYGFLHTNIRMRNPVVSSTEIHRHLHSTPQTKADKTQTKAKNMKPYLSWEPGNERGRRGRRGAACRQTGLSPASPERPWRGGRQQLVRTIMPEVCHQFFSFLVRNNDRMMPMSKSTGMGEVRDVKNPNRLGKGTIRSWTQSCVRKNTRFEINCSLNN